MTTTTPHPGPRKAFTPHAIALAAAALLSACGGGGGSGYGDVPAAASLGLSGTAATGAALAGAAVEAKCATGSGSATTASDGTYTLNISNGVLPCVARVTGSGGLVLHTVIAGTGSRAVGNLTPATQLIVARLAAGDPASYYSAFNASAAGAITPAVVAAAQAAVVATLKPGSLDFSTIADLIGGVLKAKVGSTAGDAYDLLLDALAARLTASGTTLAMLTSAVVNDATGSGGTISPSTAVSLPADMLLRPAASNCAALRSGLYRAVSPRVNSTLSNQMDSFNLNATALTATGSDAGAVPVTLTVNGSCRYSRADSAQADVVVSQAGVIVTRMPLSATNSTPSVGFAVPDQSHTLAELAGTWNVVGLQRNAAGNGYTGIAGTLTLSAAGVQSAATWCQNDSTWSVKGADCAAVAGTLPSVRSNSAGGFDIVDAGAAVAFGRAFAYRAGNGDLMMVKIDADGSFQLRTRQRSNTLPTVGLVSTFWNTYLNNQLGLNIALDTTTSTVSSLDTVSASYVRAQTTVGSNNTHPETLLANSPRDGYTFRVPGTAQTTAGATVTVTEWTALGLRGTGVSALVLPGARQLILSVAQP